MSLNGLPVVAQPSRAKTTAPAAQSGDPVQRDKQARSFLASLLGDSRGRRSSARRRGSGGFADAVYKTLRELGLGTGSTGAATSLDAGMDIRHRNAVGQLMQTLFQAVQAQSPTLAQGESSSFAAGLACVTTQLPSDEALQLALRRVLQELQDTQGPGAGSAPATPQKLLLALQRNLNLQTKVVQAKGNVVDIRA